MNFKAGDRVVFTGESCNDMTHGQTYQVRRIEDDLMVIDDAGYEHYFLGSDFEPADDNDTDDTTINFAEKAATYGIKITVIVGALQVVYDGSE